VCEGTGLFTGENPNCPYCSGTGFQHQHEWQPAGVIELGNATGSKLVFGMCKCGEIIARQYDL